MRRAVDDRTVPCQGHAVRVTLSVGATLVDVPPLHLAAAVERADQAVYRTKAGGRDCLRWHPALLPPVGPSPSIRRRFRCPRPLMRAGAMRIRVPFPHNPPRAAPALRLHGRLSDRGPQFPPRRLSC